MEHVDLPPQTEELRFLKDKDPQSHLLGGEAVMKKESGPRGHGHREARSEPHRAFPAAGLVGTPRAPLSWGQAVPHHQADQREAALIPQGPLQVPSSRGPDRTRAALCRLLIPNELVKAFLV